MAQGVSGVVAQGVSGVVDQGVSGVVAWLRWSGETALRRKRWQVSRATDRTVTLVLGQRVGLHIGHEVSDLLVGQFIEQLFGHDRDSGLS